MHEILQRLSNGDRVLDLGCASGSFNESATPATVIRADLEISPAITSTRFVRCDARRLPFAGASFQAVILNHSLEHFDQPGAVLAEIGRVIQPSGSLYVAVPDASTITDRIYRWLGRGGGHVNAFRDVQQLVTLIQHAASLPHAGTRLLFSSWSFLNRRNARARRPRRIYLLGGGSERVLRMGTFLLRKIDRWFGTRTSVYGWACWFGPPVENFDAHTWTNVCVRCGSGHISELLRKDGHVHRGALGLRWFRCPDCGTKNYFTDDSEYASMR